MDLIVYSLFLPQEYKLHYGRIVLCVLFNIIAPEPSTMTDIQ